MTKNIFILYPSAFTCQSKFDRKLKRIISGIGHCNVLYPEDPNGFIKAFFDKNTGLAKLQQVEFTFDETNTASHAIVFDDGSEFTEQRNYIKDNGIPLREININITRVVNIKREPKYSEHRSTPSYEYIGRGAYWGNPHSMYEAGDDRDEVIRKYKYDFDYEKFINIDKAKVHELTGKTLGCFCKPGPCHGDVIADYLNSWDDGK